MHQFGILNQHGLAVKGLQAGNSPPPPALLLEIPATGGPVDQSGTHTRVRQGRFSTLGAMLWAAPGVADVDMVTHGLARTLSSRSSAWS
jgi:hypothetical protein